MPASEQDTKAESIAVDAPQAAAITSLPGIVATEPEAKRADESSGNADNGGDLGQQAGAPNVSDTNLAAAGVVVADAAVAAKEATPLHANAPAAASVTDATTRHEAPPTTTHDASTQQQQEQPKQQQQQQAPQQEQPPQQQQTEKAVESPTTSNLAPAETAKASAEATAAAAAAGEKKDAAKDKAGSREPTLMDSYTELFNYASLECGAKLLAANEDAQGASNVLSESRERYTMSPCGSERWLVIELCEEVGLTAFEVANFEYFSSTFKDIQLFGSHSWPSATWVHIGNFTAQNAKKIQHFSLPETVWFKYVKVVFLTHYGSQYYCPVSVVRIHGTSHVANLKEKMISNSKEIGQRINEIKSKHKPKDPNKDASVPASPTTHPVVINDDATVPKKDTTLPKEVADLAQAGNHAAAA
ncbi:Sad1 / UNClike C-terminal domain containing protein, partial [Acanthamoeba castellanii str. Neff]